MQYIHRKRTAEAMRHAYEERLQSQEAGEGGAAAAPATGVPAALLCVLAALLTG